MDWDMLEGSSDDSDLGGSDVSDEDAQELGMSTAPAEFYDAEADDRDEKWMQKMRRSQHSDAILSCPLCFTTLCIDCQQHHKFDNQFRAMFVMNCRVKTSEGVTLAAPTGKHGKQQRRQQRRQQEAAAAARQQQQEQPQQGEPQQEAQPADAEQQQQQQDSAQAVAPTAAAAEQLPSGEAQLAAPPPQQQQQQQGAAGPGSRAGRDPSGPEGQEQLHPVCCAVCDTEVGLRDPGEGVYHFFNAVASNS